MKKLKHRFLDQYEDTPSLFLCETIAGFIGKVIKVSKQIEKDPSSVRYIYDSMNRNGIPKTSKEIANDFSGNAFEALIEGVVRQIGNYPTIGIDPETYCPFKKEDFGVDATANGKNGKLATVQLKFRSDYNCVLYAEDDHLENFVTQSYELGVDPQDEDNMLIITTAKEVHYKSMNKWNNVRYIARTKSWGNYKNQKMVPSKKDTQMLSLQVILDGNYILWKNIVKMIG